MWTQMSFSAAEENFHVGARDGIDARVYWPGVGEVPVAELVAAPAAARWRTRASTACGIDPAERDRLLGIIERRCVTQRNGASWQAAVFHRLYDERGLERDAGAARDDAALPRAHARQRARSRLAAGLSG